MKTILAIGVLAILLPTAQALGSGVPDLNQSTATSAYTGSDMAIVFIVPDGSGDSFDAAHNIAGQVADATITLVLRDAAGLPIPQFPFEDLWIEKGSSGTFTPCSGGSTCDNSTDANGQGIWCAPLQAGGWSDGPTRVMVNGSALTSGDLMVGFVSADIDGDGRINLRDLPHFAHDYYGDYAFRSDLKHDGVVNLSDVAYMAKAYGSSCP